MSRTTQAVETAPLSLLNFSSLRTVPIVRQAEVAECGLACVAMVASYHGAQMDMSAVRRLFPTSLKGTNLKRLMEIADQCHLAARALQCDLEDLAKLKLPAILHWDLKHFVVLCRVRGDQYIINDPALGQRKLDARQVSMHFTGVALELSPTREFVSEDKREVMRLRQLWSTLRGFSGALVNLLALSLLLQIFSLASPYYMQWVVDEVLLRHDKSLLTVLAIGFGMLVIFSTLTSTLRSWLVLRISAVMNLQMAVNLLRHMLRLPVSFFEQRHVGDIVSRFGSLGQVRERLTTGLVETIVDGLMSLAVLGVMLVYSVKLTCIVLAVVLIYGLFRWLLYQPLKDATEEAIRAGASEQSNFLENVRGIQTIKLFTSETHRLNLWQNRFSDVINADIKVGKMNLGFGVVNGLLFGLENVIVIYLAALMVMEGSMTIGMVLAFMAYKSQLSGRLSGLIEQLIAFRMLRLHLERLADIALEPAESNRDSQVSVPDIKGGLQLDNVCFGYAGDESRVIDRVNLSITPGECIALVGASGSGKTTLMKVMLGLLPPGEGRVLVDGIDIRQLGLLHYRRQVAAVMQDDTLLAGTVAENICFFDTEPNLLRIQQCAQLANVDEDIQRLPMAYNSLVGDMGNQFSGGQIQRLLLARALYQQPKILFLDEATSHLDLSLESRVAQHLAKLPMTRIMIAHRPETIRQADRVVHLNQGVIAELNGNPSGLMTS